MIADYGTDFKQISYVKETQQLLLLNKAGQINFLKMDPAGGLCVQGVLDPFQKSIIEIEISESNKYIVVATYCGEIKIIDLKTLNIFQSLVISKPFDTMKLDWQGNLYIAIKNLLYRFPNR